jgi:hypothetical protein
MVTLPVRGRLYLPPYAALQNISHGLGDLARVCSKNQFHAPVTVRPELVEGLFFS